MLYTAILLYVIAVYLLLNNGIGGFLLFLIPGIILNVMHNKQVRLQEEAAIKYKQEQKRKQQEEEEKGEKDNKELWIAKRTKTLMDNDGLGILEAQAQANMEYVLEENKGEK